MSAKVEFSQLPEVTFVEHDTGKVAADIITTYEGITKTVLYPGDPVRLFLYSLAAVIAQRKVETDYTGKMNLLRYARGKFLDQLGALLGAFRLDATFAETAVRFSIAEPVEFIVMIPKGTRVTADSRLFFATSALGWIPAGAIFVDIPVTAMTAGTASNGLVPGQITRLVDPLATVVTIANIAETAGGADEEEDEPFRIRIHLAPESFSTAGPELAYVYWARSAHPNIADVSVDSPTPGVVKVYLLLNGGVIPDPDGPEIKAAKTILSGKKVRPLTDMVEVLPAVAEPLDFCYSYYLTEAQAGFTSIMDDNMKKVAAEYRSWQTGIIGRDIIPDELIRLCRASGAKRIVPELVTARDSETGAIIATTPMVFMKLGKNQVAQIAGMDGRVRFGGIEDE